MTVRQLWVQSAAYNAIDDRALLAAILPIGTAGPIGSAVGLRDSSDLQVAVNAGGATGVVSRGAAYIAFGPSIYLLSSDAATNIAFTPASPTQARIDIVVAQVYDAEVGGPDQAPDIHVITGVPAASPVAPAVPAGALLLSSVRFEAASTAPTVTRQATNVPSTPILAAPQPTAALLDAYPMGQSIAVISGAFAAADGGFPAPTTASVLTIRTHSLQAYQYWYRASATQADIWYRSASATGWSPWVKMAGDILRAMSGSSAQSIPDNTHTLVSWATTEQNIGDITFVGNGFTVGTAGNYLISVVLNISGGTSPTANSGLMIGIGPTNGAGSAGNYRSQGAIPGAGTGGLTINGTWENPMGAGDTAAIFVLQNSGNARPLGTRRVTIRRIANRY